MVFDEKEIVRNFGSRIKMWRYLRFPCPKCKIQFCENHLVDSYVPRCPNCRGPCRTFRCSGSICKFQTKICTSCDSEIFENRRINTEPQANAFKPYLLERKKFIYLVFLLLIVVAYGRWNSSSESDRDLNVVSVRRLKADYPSQESGTWHHVLSVLEKDTPSVKSLIFLHEEDKTTCNCLTSELVSLYTNNRDIKMEDITFSTIGPEVQDYGFLLERYRTIVERFRVLVTDLTKVSGNIARLFHSLCDEVSSDIKPSLFIFTLKCDKKTENLRPIERAASTLREAWSHLPQNEISPLLSRIIKNVVNIVPERQANC